MFTVSCVIWREDIMPSLMTPGSRSFFALSVPYAAAYAICMIMRQQFRVDPPPADEMDDDYEHPFQPLPILFDGCVKIVLTHIIQHRIMNRAHRDNSPHVS